MNVRDRLVVALDVPSAEEALVLVERLAGLAGMFKVGSQLFTASGPDLVRGLVARGEKVFLDLKYHDIPNTVAGAVSAACRLGVSLVDAMPAMGTRLLAITVLTSHDAAGLDELGVAGEVTDTVRRLARLAHAAEVDGVVASPQEVPIVRDACGKDFLIVTPGIRPAGARTGDQARSAIPAAALKAGADLLVVGRPIIEAPDPAAAARAILREMEGAA